MRELTDCLTETIRLARERSAAQKYLNQISVNGVDDTASWLKGQPIERQRYLKTQEDLEEYLDSLDYHMVKDIMAVMYLGRDKEYVQADSCAERLQTARKNADRKGLQLKREMLDKLTQKADLAQYLQDGMKILGLPCEDGQS